MINDKDKAEKGKENIEKLEGDLDVFFPTPEFILTIRGDRIEIPLVCLEKEIEIGQAITRILKNIPDFQKLDLKKLQGDQILKLIPIVVEKLPEDFIFIVSKFLEKEPEWVKKNLDLNICIDLILPFFFKTFRQLVSKLTKYESLLDSLNT